MLSTFTVTMFTCECWSWKATSSRLRSKVVMKELYCIALYSAGKYQCPDQLQFTESHSKQDPDLGFFSKTTDNNEQLPCEVLGAGIGFYHLHLWKILLVLMHLTNNNAEAVNDFGTYKILKWIFVFLQWSSIFHSQGLSRLSGSLQNCTISKLLSVECYTRLLMHTLAVVHHSNKHNHHLNTNQRNNLM